MSTTNLTVVPKEQQVAVGGVLLATTSIEYNLHRHTVCVKVRNTGDRPIQVGSHFHFFEVNRYLQFDRHAAFGHHLNIPASTAIRFEPGDEKEVELVTYCGKSRLIGFNNLTTGYTGREDEPSYYPIRDRAFRRIELQGFKSTCCPHCHCNPSCDCGPDCDCTPDCTCTPSCDCGPSCDNSTTPQPKPSNEK